MAAVVAQPHFIFGMRTGVKGSVCFSDEHTVVFPSGNSCVCFNTAQRSQRFLSGSEKSGGMRALSISANRRYLAVSECGQKASVTVFDLQHEQGRKRKVLTAGDLLLQEYVCMAFSPDSKYLIGLTGAPQWTLVLWLWEKHKVLATVKTNNTNNRVNQVSFNPHNNMQICVTGDAVFKLFRYFEGALKQSNFAKVDSLNFLCHVWVSEERVIAGTDTGRLLVFDSGDLRREISFNPKPGHGPSDGNVMMKKVKDGGDDPALPAITAMLSYSNGFVCSLGPGTVSMFEKTDEDGYRRTRDILIPADSCCSNLGPAESQEIESMRFSPAEETLVISTERGQLYSFNLQSSDHRNKEGASYFEFLSHSFHSNSITGLSVCVRKPLVATSSVDCSVRIWNYETKVLEIYREFQEEAHSVALHPSGLYILVGFSDKLRLMNLVMDDIRTFKEFTVRGCKECVFSHGGHMFAAANGNVINIYSVTSFENIMNLKGHNGKVRSVKWSLDDSRLVSGGLDGAVYEWNTQTGKRESESVLKSCSYTDVSFSSDFTTVLAVGSDLTLKEIQDCQVLREVAAADDVAHTALAAEHTGRVVFTGTSSGAVRAIKYPLPTQWEWTTYQAHCGAVTKMVITYDGQFLLTVSEDGCLLMWRITDKEGRRLKSGRQIVHTEEVLVTKSDLEEKNQNLQDVRLRLEEVQMENEYQLHLKDMNYKEKLKQISDKFIQEIESLNRSEQGMKTAMEKQQLDNQQKFADASTRHDKELQDLEVSYSQKLIMEHEKFQDLQLKHQRMQERYEEQLKAAEERQSRATEEMTVLHDARLQEKTQLLAQCHEGKEQQISELKEIIKQKEEEDDRRIHQLHLDYEKKLLIEREANANLKGQSGVMTQKFYRLQRQIDDRNTDINKLKQERQKLLGLISTLESDIQDLKRQISGHQKTSHDKDNTISGLKKKNQELEKLKFVLDFQLNELKRQTEPQQDEINRKKEMIHQLEEELVQTDKSNSQLKITVSELKLRLRTKDKELHTEMEKIKDMETHLKRLKSDLHQCMDFIQDPKPLKESVKTIYTRYVTHTDRVEKNTAEEEVRKAFLHQREYLEKTINNLKTRMRKSAEDHDKVYTNIMKENVSLISEINELREELCLVRNQAKDLKAQLLIAKKAQKPRPASNPVGGVS